MRGPKVCQNTIPNILTAPAWTVDTKQVWCMDSCCWCQILILPSVNLSRNQNHQFFQSSTVQFWWVCAHYSRRFLLLADRSGTWHGALLPICLIPTCFSRLFNWITRVSLSAPTSLALPWPPSSTRCFHPQNCWIFFLVFGTVLSKLQRLLGVKTTGDQHFQKHTNQPVWHQQICHSQSHLWDHLFFLILILNIVNIS